MNIFARIVTSLALSFIGTFAIGGLLMQIAKFAQHPISFRTACAGALLFSLYETTRIKWQEEDPPVEVWLGNALRTLLGYGIFALFLLAFGWAFTLIS